MHPLKLDYITKVPMWTREGAFWLMIGLGLLMGAGTQYSELSGETSQISERLEQLQQADARERRNQTRTAEQLKAHRAEITESQGVLSRLMLPWDRLFVAVERSAVRHRDVIALTAIHPDLGEGRVVIEGAASDMERLLDFVADLPKSPIIRHAFLSHHQREDKETEHPVRFSIIAEWKI